MPETKKDGGIRLAEKLLYSIQMHQFLGRDDSLVKMSFSAGVAEFPADGGSRDELVKRADHAMYEAKQQGKACVLPF